MADSHDTLSSVFGDKFEPNDLNLEAIRALNDCGYLEYDGIRVKWIQDIDSLKDFFKNSMKLSGKWTSPGGKSKMFRSSNLELTATWYPGKQNSLLFRGEHGKLLEKLLVRSVLKSTHISQVDIGVDCLHGDMHAESESLINNDIDANCNQMSAETDLPNNLSSVYVSTNTESADSCFPLCSSCPSCISCISDMKKIKSDVAVMQKQIKSSNNVIESTNSIINSNSNLLETLLEDFADKLNVKNKEIEKRDRIIEGLQEKLSKLEREGM